MFVVSSDIWAFEARARLVFVHTPHGRFDIDLSRGKIATLLGPLFLRVHRDWLVGLTKVRELRSENGVVRLFAGTSISKGSSDPQGVEVPVARERTKEVRRRLLADTFGLRPAGRESRSMG